MKITKANIEQYIFEYHEGILTTKESNLLMDFIHQNPQYESLFSTWAMSYAHVEQEEKEYQVEKMLLRNPFWHFGKFIVPSMLFLACFGYFLLNDSDLNNEQKSIKKEFPKTENQILKEKNTEQVHEYINRIPVYENSKSRTRITPLFKTVNEMAVSQNKKDSIPYFQVVMNENPIYEKQNSDTNHLIVPKIESNSELKTIDNRVDSMIEKQQHKTHKKIKLAEKIEPINSDF
jgi:hypothetical protein